MGNNKFVICKDVPEQAKARLSKFINKVFVFGEDEKISGYFKYNYATREFSSSTALRFKDVVVDDNDMVLLRNTFMQDKTVENVLIKINIDRNVFSGSVNFGYPEFHIVKYEIDRLRLKCSHLNAFPLSNGDQITMERIETAIETFISMVKQDNPEIKLQFVHFENNQLILGTATEEIKKGIHSNEYLIYRSIIDEIDPPHHSKTALMFFPDDSISACSVVVSVTEYDENRKAINTENETFLVDMK